MEEWDRGRAYEKASASPILTRLRRDARAYTANLLPGRSMGKFCILATPRTGSTLLVELLDAHPNIRCDAELLATWRDFPYLFVRGRSRAARYRGRAAYGFKVMAIQLNDFLPRPHKFVRDLVSDGFVFVHLRRRNLLHQAVSILRAMAKSEWHRYGSVESRPPPITVDVPSLVFWMRFAEIHNQVCAGLIAGVPQKAMWYEDHLARTEDQQAAVDELCEMLAIGPHPVTSRIRKMASPRLEDDVANIDEVAGHLSGTRYACFLDGAS